MKAVKILLCVVALSLFVVQSAFAEVNLSADVETNTTVEMDSNGSDYTDFTNDGRVKVTVESKTENEEGFFVAGKAQGLVKIDGTAAADDAYVQVGTGSWNLRVGRYEAEGLFAKGEDVYIADAGGPGTVETNKSRGRTAGALGLQFSPSETMTVEINTIIGNADNYEYSVAGETVQMAMNKVGFRPALIVKAGSLSTSFGADYYMEMPDDSDADREYTALGAGGKLEFALSDAMKIGGAFGYLSEEGKDANGDDAEDETSMSFSGYLTMGLGDDTLGIGAMMTQRDEADDSQMQGFVSYAHALPVEGAKVKFCGSFSQWSDGDDVSAYGGRMRFNYDF